MEKYLEMQTIYFRNFDKLLKLSNNRFLDESIPWLEVNKKTEQYKSVIKHAARINRIPLETVWPPPGGSSNSLNPMPEHINIKAPKNIDPAAPVYVEHDADQRQYMGIRSKEARTDNILDVVRHRTLCIYLLVFSFIW